MAVAGDLTYISLSSVIQMLCIEHRCSALRLQRRGEEGTIFIDNGEIIHAKIGDVKGEDAFYHLLTWADGSFRIDDPLEAPPKTIGLGWNHLLLEGTRKFDEKKRHRPPSGVVTPAELQQDQSFGNDLLALLYAVEQEVEHLRQPKVLKNAIVALGILENLTNHVVIFAELCATRGKPIHPLSKILVKAHAKYPRLRLVLAIDDRVSLKSAMKLIRDRSWPKSDREEVLRQIFCSCQLVLKVYCKQFAGCFLVAEGAEEWDEVYKVFLVDLNASLAAIKL